MELCRSSSKSEVAVEDTYDRYVSPLSLGLGIDEAPLSSPTGYNILSELQTWKYSYQDDKHRILNLYRAT